MVVSLPLIKFFQKSLTFPYPLVNHICPVQESLNNKNFSLLAFFKSHWTHWSTAGRIYKLALRKKDDMDLSLRFDLVERKILHLRNIQVLLDSDVAELYGVKTRDINKAVKNNLDKFPKGYILELSEQELAGLRWKFSTTKLSKTRVFPKAFTEKGLYMLATILKSESATKTTLAIIETFARLKHLTQNIKALSLTKEEEHKKTLLKQSSELVSDLFGEALSESETSIELNFAVLKLKHTLKKKSEKQ